MISFTSRLALVVREFGIGSGMLLGVVYSLSSARRWQVILISRGRDDFQRYVVAPFREPCSVLMLFIRLFFEPVLVVHVNFGVVSGSIAALELGEWDVFRFLKRYER